MFVPLLFNFSFIIENAYPDEQEGRLDHLAYFGL